MRNILLILFAFVAFAAYSQIPGTPTPSGVITPGPPYVTGVAQGDGELKLQFGYFADRVDSAGLRIDSSKAVFDYEIGYSNPDSINAGLIKGDSIRAGAMYYTDTYWDDLRVPLTNTRITPVNTEPDFEDRGDGLFAWGFDSDSDSAWVLNFTAQTPHKRKDSTFLEAHIHWQPDGTNTGNVVWKLIYSTANIDGSWTATDTLRVVDAGDGVALKYQLVEFGMLAGSDTLRISSGIVGSLARMGDAADDTYTGTAFGIEIDFHYEIDSPGSTQEYVK